MRIRGSMYRDWDDTQCDYITHEETVGSGGMIEVKARCSSTGGTQLFIGVYTSDGVGVLEIAYDSRPETLTEALAWGVAQARKFISMEATLQAHLRA
ncbi:hypothetical protein GPJ81_14175 [Pseudomonas alkylphenolica]|uniref:Uncharacterized protein n=1 Tax=Pseudomonas alkylphenolica TaxID=237609 RepID=A0A6I6H6M4_9PSED|nr:hypothetical protein [Pseudomonas alkylphenolica]QGW77781.1 hypothetical protein GPJ81_14175 [Pseudomonas alkylphenolica]